MFDAVRQIARSWWHKEHRRHSDKSLKMNTIFRNRRLLAIPTVTVTIHITYCAFLHF